MAQELQKLPDIKVSTKNITLGITTAILLYMG